MQKIKKRITALLLTGAFFLVIPSVRFLTEKGLSVMAAENPYGWDLITSYTTYYDTKQTGRCENIRLAAKLIDGITLQAYGEFSFNATVGKRTQEAGYKESKIIVNGEYVEKKDVLAKTGKVEWGVGHIKLIKDYYDCLATGRKFPIGFNEAKNTIYLIRAMYASNGKELIIKE